MNIFRIPLLLSYICIASFSAVLITPAMPAIGHSFHLPHSALSWIVSIFLVGYVLGQLIYGPIAKKYGALKALRYGLVINLLGIIVCFAGAHFTNYNILLAGRFVTALGAASGLACTFMLMHEVLNDQEYKRAMSYIVLPSTFGIGLAALIGGFMSEYFNWQANLWVLLIHGAIALSLTWCFKSTQQNGESLRPTLIIKNYWRALINARLIVFALVVGSLSSFCYVYAAVAPIYAQTSLQQSASAYGSWNLLNMLGMLIGGLLGAKIMNRVGPGKLLICGFIGLTPCCASLLIISSYHLHNIPLFYITTMFMYLFGSFLFPSGSYFALESTTDKSNGSSMMSFINMMSATVSVIIVAHLPLAMISSFAILVAIFFAATFALSRVALAFNSPR